MEDQHRGVGSYQCSVIPLSIVMNVCVAHDEEIIVEHIYNLDVISERSRSRERERHRRSRRERTRSREREYRDRSRERYYEYPRERERSRSREYRERPREVRDER